MVGHCVNPMVLGVGRHLLTKRLVRLVQHCSPTFRLASLDVARRVLIIVLKVHSRQANVTSSNDVLSHLRVQRSTEIMRFHTYYYRSL